MVILGKLRARATYANVTATLALFVALGGGSFAVAALSGSEKKVVKKVAKQQAAKQIAARAPGLSVAYADSADNANNLGGQPAGAFASQASEPYREVGTPGNPGFQNGWQNVGGATSTVAFYKDSLGIVHLRGNLVSGINGETAFTLPAGYRPPKSLFMPAATSGLSDSAAVELFANGNANVSFGGSGAPIIGLAGLSFRADS